MRTGFRLSVRHAWAATVSLVVLAAFCATAQAAPVASFTVSPSANIAAGADVFFDASSSVAAPDATYSWDFGDGDSTAPQPGSAGYDATEFYGSPGVYTVTLTVSDGSGTASTAATITVSDRPPQAAFTVNGDDSMDVGSIRPGSSIVLVDQSSDPNPSGYVGAFAWSFGDGQTARGDQVAHTYAADGNYTVTETVTDNFGISARTSAQLTVDANPVAVLTAQGRAVVGEKTSFGASGSHTVGVGQLTDYSWDFGDGTSADTSRSTVPHVFSRPGRFRVSVTVTDALGFSSSSSLRVTVAPNPRVFVLPVDGVGSWPHNSMSPGYKPSALDEGRAGWDGRLRWTGWGSRHATGHGIGHIWLCTTSCAGGHFVTRPVVVLLSLIRVCGSRYQYTGWQEYNTGARIPGFPQPGRPKRLYYLATICAKTVYNGNQHYPYQP